jgi:hypothetical protein
VWSWQDWHQGLTMTHWTDEYFDIFRFLFWEPQHLDLMKKPGDRKGLDEVLDHLRRMEVTLNHEFNLFFRLAPQGLVREVLRRFGDTECPEPLELINHGQVEDFCRVVQPDLLLQGDAMNFSIEMKIGARSSLEQVWKYALLHWLDELRVGATKTSVLLFMGPRSFADLWPERFETPKAVVEVALEHDISSLVDRAATKESVAIDWEAVGGLLQRTAVGFCSYQEFADLLGGYLRRHADDGPGGETLRKLFGGMRGELVGRGLVKG